MRISDWSSDVCSSDLRSTDYDGRFEIPTFEEILTLLAEVNRTRDKPVGVYPETKHPSYFASIGLPHEAPLLALLGRFGYRGRTAPVFIQSFEVGNLIDLRAKIDLPLIQFMDAADRKSTRLNSRHSCASRMPSSA